jgi:hypothetical protein
MEIIRKTTHNDMDVFYVSIMMKYIRPMLDNRKADGQKAISISKFVDES